MPEVADAVEATTNESTVQPFEINLSPALDRLKDMLNWLKDLAPEDSMARVLITAIAAELIVRYIADLLSG